VKITRLTTSAANSVVITPIAIVIAKPLISWVPTK
jgi:hypothetical protein